MISTAAGVLVTAGSVVVEVRDLATGAIAGRAEQHHVPGDAFACRAAFDAAWREASTTVATVITVGGAPLTVVLDPERRVIGDIGVAPDADTEADAVWLGKQFTGGDAPLAGSAIAKLSWLHRSEPDDWRRVAHVMSLPDWLTMQLSGVIATGPQLAATTGYWSAATSEYRWDRLAIVDNDRDWSSAVPQVHAGGASPVATWHGADVTAPTIAGSAADLFARLGDGHRRDRG